MPTYKRPIGFEELRFNVEQRLIDLFETHLPSFLVYHNIVHTRNVIDHVHEIAMNYHLNEKDLLILSTAAWHHDAEPVFLNPSLHEANGVKIVNRFFYEEQTVPFQYVETIDYSIFNKKNSERIITLIEQIIYDANLYYLGTEEFRTINEIVKQEALIRGESTDIWDAGTLEIFRKHEFQTDYCKEKLASGKDKNIKMLIRSSNK